MADINDVLIAMNAGFSDLHKKFDAKIDDLCDEFNKHREPCERRFQTIETRQAVKDAVNGAKKEETKDRISLWQLVLRTAIVTGTGGVILFIWKLFLGHISIIGG